MNSVAVRNAHELLRSAFFSLFQDTVNNHHADTGRFAYTLSDGEAVDWLHQLLDGDVVISLYYNEDLNTYLPALGVC